MYYINPFSILPPETQLPLTEGHLRTLDQYLEGLIAEGGAKAIDTLKYNIRIPKYQELYLQLYQDELLHNYLDNGDLSLFEKPGALDRLFTSKGYFKFWKKFFLWRYNTELGKAYFDKDIQQFKLLDGIPFDLTNIDRTVAYRDVRQLVEQDLQRISQLEIEFRDKWLNSQEVLQQVDKVVWPALINTLPSSLIQLREAFAYRLLDLATLVYNDDEAYDTAREIMELSMSIELPSASQQDMHKYQSQLEEYVHTAGLLDKYHSDIEEHLKRVTSFQRTIDKSKKNTQSSAALLEAMGDEETLTGLKNMPSRFHFFANEYYKGLRIFSAHAWNANGDFETAYHFLETAEQLPLSDEKLEQLRIDKATLRSKLDKGTSANRPVYASQKVASSDSGALNLSIAIGIIILALLISIASRWDDMSSVTWPSVNSNSGASTAGTGSPSIGGGSSPSSTSTIPTPADSGSTNASEEKADQPLYKEEGQLSTGESPYDPVFGGAIRDQAARSYISIDNRSNLDAVVCLKQRRTGKVIRNEYIRNGDDIRISKVPSGDYELITFYGSDWSKDITFRYEGDIFTGGFLENFCLVLNDGGQRIWELYDIASTFTTHKAVLNPPNSIASTQVERLEHGLLSWDLNGFGRSVEQNELELVQTIIQKFDVIALQGLHIGSSGAHVVEQIVEQLNADQSSWSFSISSSISNVPYKSERYAFIWNDQHVALNTSPYLEESLSQSVISEPFVGKFSIRGEPFTLINFDGKAIGTRFTDELDEVIGLQGKYPGEVLIIAGKLADNRKTSLFEFISGKGFRASPRYQATELKTSCVDGSYLGVSSCFILYPAAALSRLPSGSVDYIGSCDELFAARRISDHLPIWVRLDGDNGPLIIE